MHEIVQAHLINKVDLLQTVDFQEKIKKKEKYIYLHRSLSELVN